MREGAYHAVPRARLVAAAQQSGALSEARERAAEFAGSARDALEVLPPSQYRDALAALPTFILERDK